MQANNVLDQRSICQPVTVLVEIIFARQEAVLNCRSTVATRLNEPILECSTNLMPPTATRSFDLFVKIGRIQSENLGQVF
jgi:hypothetical protein